MRFLGSIVSFFLWYFTSIGRVVCWLHCYEKSNCNSSRDCLSLLY